MTIADYKKKLDKIRKNLNVTRNFIGVTSATITAQSKRIFQEGKDYAGKPIGVYSTKPLYASPGSIPKKLTPRGKYGDTVFKNGKPHKTTYVPGGYAQLKQLQGRGSSFNLFMFGNFNRAYLAAAARPQIVESKDKIVLFFMVPATPANPQGKIDGLLNKYPNAFKYSRKERKDHVSRVEAMINNMLK